MKCNSVAHEVYLCLKEIPQDVDFSVDDVIKFSSLVNENRQNVGSALYNFLIKGLLERAGIDPIRSGTPRNLYRKADNFDDFDPKFNSRPYPHNRKVKAGNSRKDRILKVAARLQEIAANEDLLSAPDGFIHELDGLELLELSEILKCAV